MSFQSKANHEYWTLPKALSRPLWQRQVRMDMDCMSTPVIYVTITLATINFHLCCRITTMQRVQMSYICSRRLERIRTNQIDIEILAQAVGTNQQSTWMVEFQGVNGLLVCYEMGNNPVLRVVVYLSMATFDRVNNRTNAGNGWHSGRRRPIHIVLLVASHHVQWITIRIHFGRQHDRIHHWFANLNKALGNILPERKTTKVRNQCDLKSDNWKKQQCAPWLCSVRLPCKTVQRRSTGLLGYWTWCGIYHRQRRAISNPTQTDCIWPSRATRARACNMCLSWTCVRSCDMRQTHRSDSAHWYCNH